MASFKTSHHLEDKIMYEAKKEFIHKCRNGICAEILYNFNVDKCKWEFNQCRYQVNNASYTLNDWEDLHELSEQILKLDSTINKECDK